MRSLLVVVLLGLVAYSAALPIKEEHDVESPELDQFDQGETAVYGFGKKLRKGLKKVGKAIESGAKKALEHGVSWNFSVYSLEEDAPLRGGLVELLEIADEIDQAQETNYGFGKKLRKGLKKAGRAIEKGAKKALERGLSWNFSTYALQDFEVHLALVELFGLVDEIEEHVDVEQVQVSLMNQRDQGDDDQELTLEEIYETLGLVELANAHDTTYGFGKKLRKGLKKVGRALEKAGKKALEHGVNVKIPIAALLSAEGLSVHDLNEVEQLLQVETAFIGDDAPTVYGFGRKLRKGLKKAGRAIEKAGKKAIERGINVPIPIAMSSADEEQLTVDDVLELADLIDLAQQHTYGLGSKIKKGLRKVGKGLGKAGSKILDKKIRAKIEINSMLAAEGLSAADLNEVADQLDTAAFDTTYGFGRKLRRGLRKAGRALKKAGKKVLEKGVVIPIPLPI